MPIITVEGPKKTKEEKRKLAELLNNAMKEAYGFPDEFNQIVVVIKENDLDNIGHDGVLLSDMLKDK